MLAALAFALAAVPCVVPGTDSLTAQGGTGNEVHVAGLGWERAIDDDCLADRWHAGFLFRIDAWVGHRREGRDLTDASVTPFLRYELGRPLGMPVQGELGMGVHLLSRTRIDYERQFSTAFQFGEFAGLSTRFGDREQYAIGARIQHVSNGGIKRPNDGLTYGMVFFDYRF